MANRMLNRGKVDLNFFYEEIWLKKKLTEFLQNLLRWKAVQGKYSYQQLDEQFSLYCGDKLNYVLLQ